jgi:lipopolysaccharide/colanic/teichoic acid biosynthesis glycosyltransferase/glycosyltransferase involved in cell wall biosynthesis
VLVAITDPMSTRLLRGQLAYLREAGFAVALLSSPGEDARRMAADEGAALVEVPMAREISPLRDLAALLAIVRALRRMRPDVVNAGTAKAGLLVTLAAWLVRVPSRVYTLRGLRLETTRGPLRALLWTLERLTCALAHRVVCVSPSLRARAVEVGVVPAAKTVVIGGGSSNGVELARFGAVHDARAAGLRAELGVDGAPVAGFVGRIVRDKGIEELAAAWAALRDEFPAARLLLVGPLEAGDPVSPASVDALRADPRVHLAGGVDDPAPYYRLMDVLVLPTYREGFPNVLLEAGASGLPVVATRVPGCVDAVAEGETGSLVPARDADALAAALRPYLADAELRRRHGAAARERVAARFGRERIWEGLAALYRELARGADGGPRRDLAARASGGTGYRVAKRALDVAGAGLGLILLAPVLLLAGAAVWASMGRPVLFAQPRAGLHGRRFVLYKLRTMADRRDASGALLPDEQRMTRVGTWLRESSVDELPQLINVLRGDMSLVGPRPLFLDYVPLYTPAQAERLRVPPGLTGWTQVNGRNLLDWEKRLELDRWYVRHASLWLDLRILARTVWAVLRRVGVHQEGHVSSETFRGSSPAEGREAP